ncbi:MAG TPA: sorbosone dehydrogenase family protein [Phycisphaerae bacterium]|jgi:glucose/arabinose dehydrogenase|nr:sorbosone dehydrogenase family protein [Phycisphaerae bacterium]HOJ53118.1 sorbosone dehydrogenase family protein [Phycisphaerae bacterium]HOL24855.1 sorbosone dehydrogenase family protein [Phycisphaerae bacterium]HPP19391.1 sorbosone dehydrogenase family protein [Phycisphaerae bacterium]HPU32093.1 sorbosone dehydrogenase family protein [Phycisphaerae bacterium]
MNQRAATPAWWTLSLFVLSVAPAIAQPALPLSRIRLPEGFRIEIYSRRLDGARSMTFGKEGTLFVGTRKEGKVYAVVDRDRDGVGDVVYTLATGLNEPNGVAFKDGHLYVQEISRLLRFDNIEKHLDAPPRPKVISRDFPSDAHHGWKFIAFGPDGLLYVPVGAPCNICVRRERIYATITRLDPDKGGQPEIFAEGIRNTVGFDWHPKTRELWFTENGRDWLGDDLPPDELNHAPRPGMHFGYPACYGKGNPDPEFGRGKDCSQFTPPVLELPAHVAALGMRFYTGKMFPKEFQNQIFIAEHGSWNRTVPVGYRVTLVRLEGNRAVRYEPFATGWLQGREAWGRPVDVQVAPDGSLLVSDDKAGVIYRISYKAPASEVPEGRVGEND